MKYVQPSKHPLKRRPTSFKRLCKKKRQQDLPSVVKCLGNFLNSCLTYLEFPEDEWISLSTNNVIERLNKEFKHRSRPMEIVAGENVCYRLPAFISLKIELQWVSTPLGKVRRKLPFSIISIECSFTQNSLHYPSSS